MKNSPPAIGCRSFIKKHILVLIQIGREIHLPHGRWKFHGRSAAGCEDEWGSKDLLVISGDDE